MTPHDSQNDFADKPEGEDEIIETRDWRNEHGQPDFAYLNALAKDGTIEAVEKLKSIAEDLDVGFDSNPSPEELVERITAAVAENGDEGAQPTT